MSVSPTVLLQEAEKLVLAACSEVECRNAISRAYYAAFHAADAFHASLALPGKMSPKKTGHHEELFYRLANPNIPPTNPHYQSSRIIAAKTRDFHRIRVEADYEISKSKDRNDALDALDRAKEIFRLADIEYP